MMVKRRTRAGKMSQPRRPAVRTRRRILAKVIRSIRGQMWRRTVASFGSGSDLSFGLKIRYDLVGITTQRKVQKEVTLMRPRIETILRCRGRGSESCYIGQCSAL